MLVTNTQTVHHKTLKSKFKMIHVKQTQFKNKRKDLHVFIRRNILDLIPVIRCHEESLNAHNFFRLQYESDCVVTPKFVSSNLQKSHFFDQVINSSNVEGFQFFSFKGILFHIPCDVLIDYKIKHKNVDHTL